MKEESGSSVCRCDHSAIFPRCDRNQTHCPLPPRNTDVDWAEQNRLHTKWLQDNPNAGYIGWTSI